MRRKLLISGAAVLILGGAIAGFVLARESGTREPASNLALPPATATVTRSTLVETKTVSGTLGYGEPVPIRAGERGTLTWIAPVSSTVRRGQPLFKVDERPVVALLGSLPLYRPLRDGSTGRDVRELEWNLASLGYTRFPVDNTYTAATAEAVRAWQARLGLPATGTVELGQVVFMPGPVRIVGHTARIGDIIGGESGQDGTSVLSYTGTTRQVTVELDIADQALAVKGRTVTVTVPGRGTMKGTISQGGTVVTAQSATPDAGTASAGASSTASDERIEVTVTIANQGALGSLQAAPVDVDLASSKREDVLAVPVVALLALAKGGFAVQVVDGATTRIVPVKTGMFAAGQVEIRGKGIAEGMRVGIPK